MKSERALERFVLDLDLDWDAFHYLLLESLKEVDCNHDHTLCRRILALMGLEDEAIQACLSYFTLQGGSCDCEVVLNVDMTEPKPLVDFSCEDCGSDYDEHYMVQNDIWKAYGAGDGMLCIGCLEKRIGRKLRRQDFIDLPINEINPETQSLRLQDRLSTEPSRQRLLRMIGARCHIPIADAKTASVRHRARILDRIYAALRPSPPRRWKGGR